MDLRQLAAKQKRIAFWRGYLTEIQDRTLRAATSQRLHLFSEILARCWSSQSVSTADAEQLLTLERELESLNETARITVVGRAQALS